jgi:phosphoribosylformylglycinamidine synthase
LKFGVIVFPGSNCERETQWVLEGVLEQPTELVWHDTTDVARFDCLVLPGGFAHGDYLRAGAIARFSPVMSAVAAFADSGKPVLGICNGFQVLLEAGLLPGAMMRNAQMQFRCGWVYTRVESTRSPFLQSLERGQVLRLPIAHGEGNYYIAPEELGLLEAGQQVALRYCDAEGRVSEAVNPNGSVSNIAGVLNREGNVLGMMPHPERASESLLGSDYGRLLFASVIQAGAHVLSR